MGQLSKGFRRGLCLHKTVALIILCRRMHSSLICARKATIKLMAAMANVYEMANVCGMANVYGRCRLRKTNAVCAQVIQVIDVIARLRNGNNSNVLRPTDESAGSDRRFTQIVQ